MTEDYWANSPFSLARYTGVIRAFGAEYLIVDKLGRDIFECSFIAEKEGREKAIEPGEPCDLCRREFIPIYRQLGRERFFTFLKENPDVYDVKEARKRLKEWEG